VRARFPHSQCSHRSSDAFLPLDVDVRAGGVCRAGAFDDHLHGIAILRLHLPGELVESKVGVYDVDGLRAGGKFMV
jgi:hypothetical protein